jgi:hypothetical protein
MKPIKKAFYFAAGALAFVVLMLMLRFEFAGRFVSPLNLSSRHVLSADGREETITITQFSTSSTDTLRHEFPDRKRGTVSVTISHSLDTIQFTAHGQYYSEFRKARFSSNSSTELLMVPNTEHGLGFGVGEVVFLKTDSTIGVIHLESRNVGDIDSDRVFEVFDPSQGVFTHLDRAKGVWAPYSK